MAAMMSCHDVSGWLPALGRGKFGLTEWALVEIHLAGCARCRQELEQVRETANCRRRVPWRQALPPVVRRALEATRLPGFLTALRQMTHLRIMLVALASSGGIATFVALAVYVADRHHDPPLESAAASIETQRLESSLASPIVDPAEWPEPWPGKPVPRPLAVSAPVPEYAEPPATAPAGGGPTQVPAPAAPVGQRKLPESSPPHAATGTPAAGAIVKSAPDQRKKSATHAMTVPSSATSPPEAEPTDPGTAPPADVIGLLRVRDRDAAWRDLATLVVRVGGTELDSRRDFLVALIPETRYAEFAEGLVQIGAWRLEAGRALLPDQVRITIRLSL